MKQLRSRLRRSYDKRRSAFLASQDRPVRRTLLTERLEDRSLLAGDLYSPYWNAITPTDVNQDGVVAPLDALVIINQLNARGSYNLLASPDVGAGEGEQASSGPEFLYDVSNDGHLTPLDALMVINALKAEGEVGDTDIVRYYIIPYAVGTNTPIATIAENQDFELRIFVDDVRQPFDPGVYAAFLDIVTDTSKVDVYVNEIQHVNIFGSPTGGTFTLTFNGQTTAPIPYSSSSNTTANVEAALEALPNIGANNVEVRRTVAAGAVRFEVKFVNALGDVNVPALTVNGAGLTGGSGAPPTISETAQGTQDDPVAFLNAFLPPPTPGVDYQFGENPSGNLAPGRWNDIGSISDSFDFPDTLEPLELARVRLKATEGGRIEFQGDVVNVQRPDHDTLVFANSIDPNQRFDVPPANIGIYSSLPGMPFETGPAFVFVTENVSAVADAADTTEETAISIPVLANDTKLTGGTLAIQSVNTAGTNGTAVIQGGSILFTPTANFNGVTTFTYTATDGLGNTDVATVTVTVGPDNDAPVITLPAAPPASEDIAVGITGLTVADLDATSGNLAVTLTATNGVLTLATISGLEDVAGNGSSSVQLKGTVTEVNAALNGMNFTPTAEYNGAASITVLVNDQGNTGGLPESDTETLNFTIAAVNDPPVNSAPVTVLSVVEEDDIVFNGPNALSVADPDASESATPTVSTTLTASFGVLNVMAVGHGATVTGSGTGSLQIVGTVAQVNAALVNLTYVANPDTGFETEMLSMVTSDLGHTGPITQTDTDVIQIEIEPGVLPRPRRDDTTIVAEDSVDNPIDVLANDLGNPGEFPIITGVNQPAVGGSVSVNDNGTNADPTDDFLDFTPTPDFFGTVTFTYSMNETDNGADGIGADLLGTVTVTVTNTQDAPVASDDTYSTSEDIDLVVALPGVLGNDDEIDNEALTAIVVTQPAHGTLTLNANGSFTYSPDDNYNGPDSFTYKANDGIADSNVATVNITVTAVNDAPVGDADSYTVAEDGLLTVAAPGVLDGDTDVEGAGLTAAVVANPANGTLILASNGSFTYEPNDNFFGTDTFTYKANDGTTDSAPVTVTITVTPVNDLPVAVADPSYTTNEDTALVINTRATGVLGNDTDIESTSTLTAELVSNVTNGTLDLNADGTFTYTPFANFNGVDTFTYNATDGQGDSNVVTVTITVNAVNDAPVGVADSFTGASEDAIFTVLLADNVLNNDTDADSGDTKTAVAGTYPTSKGGSVTVNADGSFVYDPTGSAQIQATAQGATTTDTFTYTVRDSGNATGNATVTITIAGSNDAPTAADDAFGAIANIPETFNVLANDSDIDTGDTRTIQSVTPPTNIPGATVTFNANGEVTYHAPAGSSGVDTFTYTVVDSNGGTDTATVTVTVQNYIPTDISGYVYIDKTTSPQPNGNGQFEASERGVANVTLVLSSPTGVDMFGDVFTPRTAVTDATGRYVFQDVIPGNYVITQVQPDHLRDGLETVTDSQYASVQASQNNKIFINLPQLGAPSGAVENNNFAELGIDASSLDNSAGLLQEMLASSSQNGLVASTNLAGNDFWFWALNNWSGLSAVDIQLNANLSTLTLKATINGVQKTATIGQQPNSLGGRFRILGYTDEGGYLIRIDGKAGDFQWASTAPPAGEGEAAGDADASYVDSVDQVLAEQNWA